MRRNILEFSIGMIGYFLKNAEHFEILKIEGFDVPLKD